jgi:hypothetical protein
MANECASEPTRTERGSWGPASERVGESEGQNPSEKNRSVHQNTFTSTICPASTMSTCAGISM